MFHVEGYEIVQRKPVMARYEVYALLGFAVLTAIDFAAAKYPVSKRSNEAIFAPKETSYVVTKAPVPLPPAIPYKTW
jgi:hypothetical protein